ncbi:hypothetical protein WICMUC_004689 [Wickerhamomyces mucosus]|uniref:3-methyl-2-oxobutanoate hydroxymethyltransferase n=1 Tax=Wickerhamomyces mucosus TaxID=1378264 RepID=A0A9P8PGF2_9ASCO|nr:hypothetical protein WICMUC_004689 [Wickerhamomyces mucosus]
MYRTRVLRGIITNLRSFKTSTSLQSAHKISQKTSINTINELYKQNSKLSVLTAHDYISGKIANDSDVDIVLIGDSLAMVALGYKDTNEIPFDEFLYHCKSVSRAVSKSFLIADLPFGSYESSISKAIESSVQLISKGRVNSVKLEGGIEITPTIKKLTDLGIPVCGHIGLTPQRLNSLGGFKVQGRSVDNALKLIETAKQLENAGCFAMVLEAIPSELAKIITENISIPTIGIGAGPYTSGQVLVQADLLGLGGKDSHVPKFVKQYLNGYGASVEAVKNYVREVKDVKFPVVGKHTYKINENVLEELEKKLEKQ